MVANRVLYSAIDRGRSVLRHPGMPWNRWNSQLELARACKVVPEILPMLPQQIDAPPPAAWSIHRTQQSWDQRIAVIHVGPPGQSARTVLKVPHTQSGRASLESENLALTQLCADPRLAKWREVIPAPAAHGEVSGQFYTAQRAMPGCDMRVLLTDPRTCIGAYRAAATAIGRLHQQTATPVVIGAELLEPWVDGPLRAIRGVAGNDKTTEYLVAMLHGALLGRALSVSSVHGDYWPGNILMTADGTVVTGIVDWEWFMPGMLPMLDFLSLLLIPRETARRRTMGEVAAAFLDGEDWSAEERTVLEAAHLAPAESAVDDRVMILLYWLLRVRHDLVLEPGVVTQRRWVARNVVGVMERVGRQALLA